jgi:hypothetical protein
MFVEGRTAMHLTDTLSRILLTAGMLPAGLILALTGGLRRLLLLRLGLVAEQPLSLGFELADQGEVAFGVPYDMRPLPCTDGIAAVKREEARPSRHAAVKLRGSWPVGTGRRGERARNGPFRRR